MSAPPDRLLDMEALAIGLLLGDSVMESQDVRVATKTPKSFTRPWIRVTQINAAATDDTDHLVRYHLQFDCYAGEAGGTIEATNLGIDARYVLKKMPAEVLGVSVVRISNHSSIFDTELDPPRARVIVEADIYAHP